MEVVDGELERLKKQITPDLTGSHETHMDVHTDVHSHCEHPLLGGRGALAQMNSHTDLISCVYGAD